MDPEVLAAFEAAVASHDGAMFDPRRRSDRAVRREARLLMKQVELVLENLPDQTMSVRELYEEIAGQAGEPER